MVNPGRVLAEGAKGVDDSFRAAPAAGMSAINRQYNQRAHNVLLTLLLGPGGDLTRLLPPRTLLDPIFPARHR